MDTSLLQEAVIYKAAEYRREGVRYTECLARAGRDVLAACEGRVSPAEAYCLRLWLYGAGVPAVETEHRSAEVPAAREAAEAV